MSHQAKSPEMIQAIDILARTLYGEARGESFYGKNAVASVVLNRVKRAQERGGYWWGNSIIEVCQKKWQFSCWNENDPNRPKLLAVTEKDKDLAFVACLQVARNAVAGLIADTTKGATHYHTKAVQPKWAINRKPCVIIGSHLFYNDVE